MSLAARLSDTRNSPHGLPCPIAVILTKISDGDRIALLNELDKQMGDPTRLSNNSIRQALDDEGFPLHIKGIEKHRNGQCRCFTGSLR